MFDYAVSRQHMVDGQIRTNDVTDPGIIRAFKCVEREKFVPKAKQAVAYSDINLDVDGRTLMRPRDFAKILQALNISSTDVVLDIGCARGYSSAVMSHLAETVVAIEDSDERVERATAQLVEANAMNVAVLKADLKAGAREHGQFDVIFVNGAISDVPKSWLDQLAIGGRLAVIISKGQHGQAWLYSRGKEAIGQTIICDANVPLIEGFEREAAFEF